MVDVRDFDSIHEETVFRRTAATYDQVVAVADRGEGYSRVGADDPGDVSVRTGALFDLPQSDNVHADRAFGRTAEWRGAYGDRIEGLLILFHFDGDRRSGCGDDVFGSRRAFVP